MKLREDVPKHMLDQILVRRQWLLYLVLSIKHIL